MSCLRHRAEFMNRRGVQIILNGVNGGVIGVEMSGVASRQKILLAHILTPDDVYFKAFVGRADLLRRHNKPARMKKRSNVRSSRTETASSAYKIQQSQSPPSRIDINHIPTIAIHIAACFLWALYFVKRFAFTNSDPVASWRIWGLFFAELSFHIPEAVSNCWTLLAFVSARKGHSRPSYKLVGETAPMVDVFITVCGEELDTIMDSIAGASSQDYPINSYRVFVLDDAKDTLLERAIRSFNKSQARHNRKIVTYLARDKPPGRPHHFKAGNLRFGFDITASGKDGSEYVAALDADMIAEHDWLSRVVPHLIFDEGLALVSTPQHCYNVLQPDVLAQDSHVFAGGLEPLNDVMGCSQCSGSGYVLRRRALDDIGGWPLADIGEDIYCSNDLLGKGWRTAYIDEDLQWGLAPPSLYAYLKQRMRWTDGTLMVLRDFRFYIPGLDRGQRSVVQRVNGLLNAVKTYSSLSLSLSAMFLPGLILPTQSSISAFAMSNQDCISINRILLMACICGKISTLLVWGKIGVKTLSSQKCNRFWVAPYSAYCIIRQLFPGHKITFITTGSVISPLNERSAKKRQPLLWRILNPSVLCYFIFVLYAATAFLTQVGSTILRRMRGYPPHQFPFPGVILRVLESALRVWVLVKYMIFPEDVPERRELLQHEGHGVYRPKNRQRPVPNNKFGRNDVIEMTLILLYTWI